MSTALGEFLRARRTAPRPQAGGPGALRRQDVALHAGISVSYLAKLEQGRASAPSAPVLDRLAWALRLDDDERLHLYTVAGVAPRPAGAATPRRVSPSLRQLLDGWNATPALVTTGSGDVLTANLLARALFGALPERGNVLRALLGEGPPQHTIANVDEVGTWFVARLRRLHEQEGRHPEATQLVQELLATSARFRRLWRDHASLPADTTPLHVVVDHDEVGEVSLHGLALPVRGGSGQEIVVLQPAPGTPAAEKLALLGSLAATG